MVLSAADNDVLHAYAVWCTGFDVLTAMERVPVNGDDRPEQEIKITGASVFVNPYKEMEEEERKKAEAERKQARHALAMLHCAMPQRDRRAAKSDLKTAIVVSYCYSKSFNLSKA